MKIIIFAACIGAALEWAAERTPVKEAAAKLYEAAGEKIAAGLRALTGDDKITIYITPEQVFVEYLKQAGAVDNYNAEYAPDGTPSHINITTPLGGTVRIETTSEVKIERLAKIAAAIAAADVKQAREAAEYAGNGGPALLRFLERLEKWGVVKQCHAETETAYADGTPLATVCDYVEIETNLAGRLVWTPRAKQAAVDELAEVAAYIYAADMADGPDALEIVRMRHRHARGGGEA